MADTTRRAAVPQMFAPVKVREQRSSIPCHDKDGHAGMTRRLFVALSPPPRVADALLDMMEGVAGARWQDADNLHLTLRFIGEADRHLEHDLVTALSDIRVQPFTLSLAGVGQFSGRHRPRAIWADMERSEPLHDLQWQVECAARRAGCPAETRRFTPHVTLGRLNSGSGPIGDWLKANGDFRAPEWPVSSFSLYESDLTPNGPIYTQLEDFGQRLQ